MRILTKEENVNEQKGCFNSRVAGEPGWLKQFRSLLPLTRVLMLVEEEDQKTISRESGADEVLVKGFRGDLLIRTVRDLIAAGADGGPGTGKTNDRKEGEDGNIKY